MRKDTVFNLDLGTVKTTQEENSHKNTRTWSALLEYSYFGQQYFRMSVVCSAYIL